jgi:hypothetical protein
VTEKFLSIVQISILPIGRQEGVGVDYQEVMIEQNHKTFLWIIRYFAIFTSHKRIVLTGVSLILPVIKNQS